VNHYLTSDRFLDHRVQRYPPPTRGGSARQPYADTEAVRVLQPPPAGLEGVLREAWARYGIPLAVTEMHNGCTREEQMRWMAQGWETALRLRGEGVPVRALTAWSLVGSYGWDTLLTEQGRYEPGIYEVAGGDIRPTALVDLLKRLAAGAELPPPAMGKGWWQREMRFHHRPIPRPARLRDFGYGPPVAHPKVILMVGLDATTKTILVQCCLQRGLACRDGDLSEVAAEGREVWAVIGPERAASDTCAPWRRLGIPIMACDSGLGRAQIDQLLDRLIDRAGSGEGNVAAA